MEFIVTLVKLTKPPKLLTFALIFEASQEYHEGSANFFLQSAILCLNV